MKIENLATVPFCKTILFLDEGIKYMTYGPYLMTFM